MFKINIQKLDGKVSEKGYNKTSFSKAIGVTRNTYDNYRKHPERIPYWVLRNMIYILCNNFEEAICIFFTQ